jgi:hypothetical protein
MSLWKNASNDTLRFKIDLGSKKRELVVLEPGAEVMIPIKSEHVLPFIVPQLVKITDIDLESEVNIIIDHEEEEEKPKKRGRKPKVD